jgi:sec-independent protein translocase protein TatB
MFDIGFGEIALLLVAGLIIVGPEQLPKYAAQGARLLRQVRSQIAEAKASVNEAIALDPEVMQDLRDLNPRRLLSDDVTPIQKSSTPSKIDPDTT